jgi:hypothetical protein
MNIFNRALLLIAGLAMIAAGVLGLVRSQDWLSRREINNAIPLWTIKNHWRSISWSSSHLWLLLAGAVIVTILGLLVLFLELRPPDRGGADVVLQQTERGRTTVSGKALRRVLERQAEAVEGVSKARLETLSTTPTETNLSYRLQTSASRDIRDTGYELIEWVYSTLATTLDQPETRVTATLDARADDRPRNHKTRRVE